MTGGVDSGWTGKAVRSSDFAEPGASRAKRAALERSGQESDGRHGRRGMASQVRFCSTAVAHGLALATAGAI
jgi:hypothetical protein